MRPLLVDNCFECHSDKKQKGGLRLDSLAALLKGGKNGLVVTPGKPETSKLITAVLYKDEDLQMPPDDPLKPEQVKLLIEWVKMGTPWSDTPAVASGNAPLGKGKHRIITDKDRAFWSFQPVKDVTPPELKEVGAWGANPIDRFVLAKLRAEGLSPAAEADRVTLIRRATFDLIGLPPTPAEIDAFVHDNSSDAYEKLIDRLLASPRYGERWAQHWLDLVRYAESDGYRQDAYRPNVWPYRDYVVKAFNQDKPYDRFITEQLAGDELASGDPDVVVATGYLRHSIYEYNQRDVPQQWTQTLNDVTDVTGDVFMGLSMGCARCHDHKFDPILQADYFRLQSFFTPMLPRNDLPLATKKEKEDYDRALAAWEKKTADVRHQLEEVEKPSIHSAQIAAIKKFPEDMQVILRKTPAERTPLEEQLAQLAERQIYDQNENAVPKLKGAALEKFTALKKQLGEMEADRPKSLLRALVVSDVGTVAPPTIIPGDPSHPVDPGSLTVLDHSLPFAAPVPTPNSTGRRLALAKWLTEPGNPLTTRVMVNRIWQYHFGRGLVATSSDFGRLGTPPTHPELLDWLARQFVQDGWSIKKMHRLIMTSATYRQAALRPMPEVARLHDPEDRWLWRMGTRRLDAAQIRDAMLSVSGELITDAGGPSAEPTAPKRTIYTKALRNTRDPVLDVFDSPDTFGSAPLRNVTTTANQALLMINGDWPLKRAAAFASRLRREVKSADPYALVDAAYRNAYGREPEPQEREAAVKFLSRQVAGGEAVVENETPASDVADRPVTQTMPQRGGQAILVRNANPADIMRLPDAAPLLDHDFTVEAYVQLESVYEDASVRVIAAQWDGKRDHAGWSLGVTGERSKYHDRNLILQIGGSGGSAAGYEVIPSDFRLELHKAYYLAVSARLEETGETGITFYVKDLTDNDAPLRSVGVKHAMTGGCAASLPLMIGGRNDQPTRGWDGLIDEVRISKSALKSDELLYNDGDPKAAVVGHWLFKEQPGFFKDSAGVQKDLVRLAASTPVKTAASPAARVDPVLVDFCHVLLNSNEFLYAD